MPTNVALLSELRQQIRQETYQSESAAINRMLLEDKRSEAQIQAAADLGINLINACREQRQDRSLLDAFLDQFGLSTEEGVALMCLAESIVRVPDADTADALIADKLSSGRWREHLGASDSLLVNASTWALMLTGEVVELGLPVQQNFSGWFGRLVNRAGEPVIRQSLRYAMQLLGNEFVFATTAQEAVANVGKTELYSFDMLGEAARTADDAENYFAAYHHALDQLSTLTQRVGTDVSCFERSGISVKLSALYPRYRTTDSAGTFEHLYPKLLSLAERAAQLNVQLTLDAEEANRLDLSLGLLEKLVAEPSLSDWQGLGLAVQAYGRRALKVIEWLEALATQHQRRLIVRLVKGAYWDSEIKLAQQQGVPTYPVFTSKPATDLNYIACAQRLLAAPTAFFPQFATHNAHSLANILTLTQDPACEFEMQRLHGMGDLLYRTLAQQFPNAPRVRTYAPVGPHKHLMAYLIRRLLENGANSSFVNRFLDEDIDVNRLVRNNRHLVLERTRSLPEPPDLLQPERANSQGFDLEDPATLAAVTDAMQPFLDHTWNYGKSDKPQTVTAPSDNSKVIGSFDRLDTPGDAVVRAQAAQLSWNRTPALQRADILRKTAALLETHHSELMALLVREAGKTLEDALDEIREAVDFFFYYAAECERLFAAATQLPGPTGESNQLTLTGRGVFVCISPWNFPLAIFAGQVSAALAAGNAVIAKPAEQTTLIALRCVELFHEAGVPQDVLQLVCGRGSVVGAALAADPRIGGVVFTGSTQVAKSIQLSLATSVPEIVPLIAETGGQNCMVVDSTAMPEQVVDDVLRSAFGSAGQRCSALRVLCIQDDIADDVLHMLTGAMDQLVIDEPWQADTDVGPIIDSGALANLSAYLESVPEKILHRCTLEVATKNRGHFLAPHLLAIQQLSELDQEHFGPILHVRRFERDELDSLLEEINQTGYALTLGIHSRNNQFVERVVAGTRAGNVYVNRNMIGAVVGVQPFGGRGLSGTGPKAGGPNYVQRFAVERTVTNNVAAVGGNLALLTGPTRTET